MNIGLPELGLIGFLLLILFGGGKIKNTFGGGKVKETSNAKPAPPRSENPPLAQHKPAKTKTTESA